MVEKKWIGKKEFRFIFLNLRKCKTVSTYDHIMFLPIPTTPYCLALSNQEKTIIVRIASVKCELLVIFLSKRVRYRITITASFN